MMAGWHPAETAPVGGRGKPHHIRPGGIIHGWRLHPDFRGTCCVWLGRRDKTPARQGHMAHGGRLVSARRLGAIAVVIVESIVGWGLLICSHLQRLGRLLPLSEPWMPKGAAVEAPTLEWVPNEGTLLFLGFDTKRRGLVKVYRAFFALVPPQGRTRYIVHEACEAVVPTRDSVARWQDTLTLVRKSRVPARFLQQGQPG